MIAAEVKDLLEGGCGLLVGLVAPDGRPVATRGTGLDVLADGRTIRLLLDTTDVEAVPLVPGDLDVPIAITGARILSLHSVQVKGRLRRLEAGGPADLERAARYHDDFSDLVLQADGLPKELMARWRPAAVHVGEVEVHQVFDQTPGPNAGGLLAQVEP